MPGTTPAALDDGTGEYRVHDLAMPEMFESAALVQVLIRVTGIGGVFLRAENPEELGAWYARHLGVGDPGGPGMHVFRWRRSPNDDKPGSNDGAGSTTWALFPSDTDYLGDRSNTAMVNYRVEDLDAVLDSLRSEGVSVDRNVEEHEYGRFGWVTDPEGPHRVVGPAPGE